MTRVDVLGLLLVVVLLLPPALVTLWAMGQQAPSGRPRP